MLHRPATEVGLHYLAVMGGVPAGSFASSWLASGVRATSAIAVLGAALFFGAAVSAVLSLATVLFR
jgi:hypothetical protein